MRGRKLGMLLAAAVALAAPRVAAARGLERFQFRVNATSGAVAQTWTAKGVAANTTRPRTPARPAPPVKPAPSAAFDGTDVVVRDAAGAVIRRVPVTRTSYEFMPWSVVTSDLLVFAWREPTGKPAPDDYRDVWTSVELASGNQLWRRETPWHDPPGALALGNGAVLIDDWRRVEIVDGGTGATLGTLVKTDTSFSVTELGGDEVLLEAGSDLYLLDRRTGATRWQLSKRGELVSWTPIGDRTHRLGLLQTTAMTYRVDAARGRILWAKPSTAPTRLWVAGDRIYEASFEQRSNNDATVRLLVRHASDGRVTGDHVVQRYRRFFDIGEAVITDVGGGRVAIETTWIILD